LKIHNKTSDDLKDIEEHMTQIIDEDTQQTIHWYYDIYVKKMEELIKEQTDKIKYMFKS